MEGLTGQWAHRCGPETVTRSSRREGGQRKGVGILEDARRSWGERPHQREESGWIRASMGNSPGDGGKG